MAVRWDRVGRKGFAEQGQLVFILQSLFSKSLWTQGYLIM